MPEPRHVEPARAKVNLDLLVTGRRDDGYHELDSLVVFAPPHDLVAAEPADALELVVLGARAGAVPADEANLVLRAARLLARAAGVPPRARLTLAKLLPVAAGLGGGSADAAAALRALDRLWRLDLGLRALAELSLPLGADVPVCVFGRTARLGGIGERLAPVPDLPELHLLLVNPGVAVPTAEVFRRLVLPAAVPSRPPLPPAPTLAELLAVLRASRNDLEPAAMGLAPVIGETLARLRRLPGSRLARMSGSGATCWALFGDAHDLAAAATALRAERPEWWVEPGTVEAAA